MIASYYNLLRRIWTRTICRRWSNVTLIGTTAGGAEVYLGTRPVRRGL